jgi:putative flippase GtrA
VRELLLKYIRVIKFGAVGCVNTAVDFLVFTLVSEMLRLSPGVAQVVGYGSGILCSFVLNHCFTFSDAKKEDAAGQARRFGRFIVVNAVTLAVSAGLMELSVRFGIWKYLAKLGVTGVTMVLNYFGYKILVFKIREDEGDEGQGAS